MNTLPKIFLNNKTRLKGNRNLLKTNKIKNTKFVIWF